MTASIKPDAIYLPKEVADILRCGLANVYNLMSSKALASIRIGSGSRGLRIKGSDLLSFLDDRKEGGPSPQARLKYVRAV